MQAINNVRYDPQNVCIYCGRTTDLRDEHIVPFGLSGTAVLPKATCGCCARITGDFEQRVLRGPIWPVRVLRGLKSRTKHSDAPRELPLNIVRDGTEETVTLPISESPLVLQFFQFAPPGYLNPEAYSSGITLTGVFTISFGQNPVAVARKLRAKTLRGSTAYSPTDFARMIAKIAYAWGVAQARLDPRQSIPPVVDAILGCSDDIGRWVGTMDQAITRFPEHLHRLLVQEHSNGMLSGQVHLFSDSETPIYTVILKPAG